LYPLPKKLSTFSLSSTVAHPVIANTNIIIMYRIVNLSPHINLIKIKKHTTKIVTAMPVHLNIDITNSSASAFFLRFLLSSAAL
jgi:predicted NUDIX family NTP pyrophosphohydrolase